ncbi:DUF1176 domain-containing protein [Dickeya oryzae]
MQFSKKLFLGGTLALLSSGALAAGATILGYPAPIQKEFKNWQVTCNNLNTCQLNNYAERYSYQYVILKRDAGASGKISLSILLKPDQQAVYLDGTPFPLDAADWQIDNESDGDGKFYRYTTRLEVIQRFIQAARNAQQLALVEQPATREVEDGDVVSLNGLSAALLLADERQGRLKNRSALLNIGEGDVSQVPPVPTGQRVDITYHQPEPLSNGDVLAAAVSKAHQSVLCEPDEGEKSSEKLEAFPLSGKLALVMRKCSPGAYQGASDLFITPRNNPQAAKPVKLLALSISNAALVEMEEGPMGVKYEPQTGLLSHTVLVSSICGSGEGASWAFDGKAFQLVSYSFSSVCARRKDWPSVWAMPGYPTE